MKTLETIKNAGLLTGEKGLTATAYIAEKLRNASATGAVRARMVRKNIDAATASEEIDACVADFDKRVDSIQDKLRSMLSRKSSSVEVVSSSVNTYWEPKIC